MTSVDGVLVRASTWKRVTTHEEYKRRVEAREEYRRRLEACDFTAKTCSDTWSRVIGLMYTIFHKRADQIDYFLMVQSVV